MGLRGSLHQSLQTRLNWSTDKPPSCTVFFLPFHLNPAAYLWAMLVLWVYPSSLMCTLCPKTSEPLRAWDPLLWTWCRSHSLGSFHLAVRGYKCAHFKYSHFNSCNLIILIAFAWTIGFFFCHTHANWNVEMSILRNVLVGNLLHTSQTRWIPTRVLWVILLLTPFFWGIVIL